MRKPPFLLACLPVLLLSANLASADDLAPIRAAAQKGECVITHDGRPEPAVALTASAYDLPGADKQEVLDLIAAFLKHGCSLAQPDSEGMSPANVAVLTAEPELLSYLLKAGADPAARITGARPWANGKNSLEFAQVLNKVDPSEQRKAVLAVLARQ